MYRYFDAYKNNNKNNRSSQPVEILDEEENDIFNSNDNYDEHYGEFDEDNESIIEQVKFIKLSGYSADAEHNEKLVNETIKELHRLNDFKRIKQIHFVNQLGDRVGSHGVQCIIEYEITDAHISWD